MNTKEKFRCFLPVNHKAMGRILANEPLQRIRLEVSCVDVKPLSIFECDSCCPLHFTKSNGIDLANERRSDASRDCCSELRTELSRESKASRSHEQAMKSVLCVRGDRLQSLHDI